MKLRKTCPVCNCLKYEIIFSSTFQVSDLNTTIFSARRLPDRIHGTIVRCQSCDLIRTLEIIDLAKLKQLYTKSLFTYEALSQNLIDSYLPPIKQAIQYLKQKSSFLEIGCGNGFLLGEVKKLGFSRVVGVEPSLDAIRRADRSIQQKVIVDVLRPGLFPRGSFDLITAFQVFDHISDPSQFLEICHYYLRDSGLLLLFNHDVEAPSAKFLGDRSPIFDIEHPFLYSQKTIRNILEKKAFSPLKVYSPPSLISSRYLLRLLPLPSKIKQTFIDHLHWKLNKNFRLHLGNLCVIARKT